MTAAGVEQKADVPVRVLHVANWYPNPWDDIEGNFVKAQVDLFKQVTASRLVHVQVRPDAKVSLRYRRLELPDGALGYYFFTRFGQARVLAMLTTALLLAVLIRERIWRYDVLHVHIAWPLLAHVHLWRWLIRTPILISEHWSAYHFKFNLEEGSTAMRRMGRPFRQGIPVIAVSRALLSDIQEFAKAPDFPGYILPNCVALQGAAPGVRSVPVLFAVNVWRPIKEPMAMLAGLAAAAASGKAFKVVIGGFGELLEEMRSFVSRSDLNSRTHFAGKMSKHDIAKQLAASDGYLFSSRYETFSVACAEALGAGVPLIGPHIPAIAEYASADEWQLISGRSAGAWRDGVERFAVRFAAGEFGRTAIAARATDRFSHQRLQRDYLEIVKRTARPACQKHSEASKDLP